MTKLVRRKKGQSELIKDEETKSSWSQKQIVIAL